MFEFISRGEYEVDPGGVVFGPGDLQTQVDRAGRALLRFTVPGAAGRGAARDDPRFDRLWWIEPQADAHGGLASVTLLGTSFQLGRGRVTGVLTRAHEQGVEHWRIVIDASSAQSPVEFPGDVPPPLHERSTDGRAEAAVSRRPDGAVDTIDLWLPLSRRQDAARP